MRTVQLVGGPTWVPLRDVVVEDGMWLWVVPEVVDVDLFVHHVWRERSFDDPAWRYEGVFTEGGFPAG